MRTESLKNRTAYKLAEYAHRSIGQLRKYTGEPYIVHPYSVASTILCISNDPDMVDAALLHDVLEDVMWVHLDLIEAICNKRVASFVYQLTDYPRVAGNRATRKKMDTSRLADASYEVQTIKLADLIDNTSSIVKYYPNFAKVYMQEKKEILKVLTKGDPRLLNPAQAIVDKYFEGKSRKELDSHLSGENNA